MVITQPTVDDFSDTTVMRVIRKIVNYICSDSGLVAQINDNDITGFASSYADNVLKIDATKGDGTTIPVCNLTIDGGSSTGNPYPIEINGTVEANGNITFTVTMSSGSPLTTTINMNYFASADDLSDLQKRVTGLKLTSSGNNMSINGTSAPIVNSISGQVIDGDLVITINGVSGVGIPLPKGETVVEIPPYVLTEDVLYVDYVGGTASMNVPYLIPSDEDFFIVGTGKFKTKATFISNNWQIANYYQGKTETMRKITQDIFGNLGLEDGTYYAIVGNMFSLYHSIAGDRSPFIPEFTISNGQVTEPLTRLFYVHEEGGSENLHAGDTVFCTLLIKQ